MRDETDGNIHKFNINQPIIEKKANVARSVSKEDSNINYGSADGMFTKYGSVGTKIGGNAGLKRQSTQRQKLFKSGSQS